MKKIFTIFCIFIGFSSIMLPVFAKENGAKARIFQLQKEIDRYNYEYHVLNKSTISDAEFDKLYEELLRLEAQYPQFATKNSPTQKISQFDPKFKKVKHNYKMYSLKKVYSIEDLSKWYNNADFDPCDSQKIIAEPKLDGIAVTLIYKNGKFIQGLTRGDGETGEDFTENLKMIESVPKTLKKPVNAEIRGEVFINNENFKKLDKKYANQRNIASGSLRQANPEVTKERNLSFAAYQAFFEGFERDNEILEHLKNLGFDVVNYSILKNFDEVKNYVDFWKIKRKSVDYPTDGVVFKINNLKQRNIRGFSNTSPNWAIAFKYSAQTSVSRLKNVEFQMGKTGILTPVAVFEPINIKGSRIQKATLHNLSEIKKADLKINDEITIAKTGEIMPKIVENKHTKDSKIIKIPKNCPFCDEKLTVENRNLKCTNPKCNELMARKIEHFASQNAINIEGLGYSTAKILLKETNLRQFSDIYELTPQKIEKVSGFSKKSAENLYYSIQKSKKQSFSRLVYALSIDSVGKNSAKRIADYFKNPRDILSADSETFEKIDGINAKSAKNLYIYFKNNENKEEFQRLLVIFNLTL